MKKIWIFFLVGFFLSGCVSLYKFKKDQVPLVGGGSHGRRLCTELRNVVLSENTVYSKQSRYLTSPDASSEDRDELRMIIDLWSQSFLNKRDCKESDSFALIEISNMPPNEKPVWKAASILFLAIIPYWEDMENSMTLQFFDSHGEKIGEYTSILKYTNTQSIFIIPALPFYSEGFHELNLKFIPQHFMALSNIINIDIGSGIKALKNK